MNVNWGHYTEDNGFGTHEFIQFCLLIGAEPYFAANVGPGSPQEFGDWIEYCNFPKGSTLSDERAANGSPEPFNIRYWVWANELWGCGGNFQPEGAAAEFRRYATFANLIGSRGRLGMPRLYLVGCGPSGDDTRWTRGFMDTLAAKGPMPQGYSMHYCEGGRRTPMQFSPDDMYTQFNLFPRVELALIHQRSLLDGYDPNRQIGLILDEWGVWDQMIQRETDERGSLWIQSPKPHRSRTAVKVEYDGERLPTAPQFGGRGGQQQQQQQATPSELSVSASRQGSELIATFVNPRHDVDMDIDCALRGETAKGAKAQMLHDSDINAANTFESPERVVIKPHEVAAQGDRFRITLPAMSVATVAVQLG